MSLSDTSWWSGQKESQTLEFKEGVNPRAVAEVVCGMLNSKGGAVILGVRDDGSVIGVNNVKKAADAVSYHLQKTVSPPGAWSVIQSEFEGKPVLIVDVPVGSMKPYLVDGRVLIRVNSWNRAADAQDISKLIQDRVQIDEHWERQPAVGLTIDDLDAAEIRLTARQALEAGRFDSASTSVPEILQQLSLIVNGRPIQAAIVAFGAKLLPWYPQCSMRLARFRGVDKNEFIDQKRLSGHAFDLLNAANEFLSKHLPVRGTFQEGSMQRQDRPLYPILALREALVNALCHRDYSIPGGAISVAVFDDRLEIVSTGKLPAGMSVEDLRLGHYSQPRNPLLADLFYRRGLIDLWGRGGPSMISLCRDAGCPEPQFEERAGEFLVRFLTPNYLASVPDGVRLTDRQSRILAVLRSSEQRFLREIRDSVDASLSDSAFRLELNRLRELGLVEAVGTGRGAHWRAVRQPN